VVKKLFYSEFENERWKDLEGMLDFFNADIGPMKEREFLGLLHEYAHFMYPKEAGSKSQFLEFSEKHEQITRGLGPRTSPEALKKRKKFFTEIQSHIRSRIRAIMDVVELQEIRSLWEMRGYRELMVYSFTDCFQDLVRADKRPKKRLSLESEKREFDIWFADIARDLDLKPSRFKKCTRCSNFFYQPTARKRKYCSTKCAAAVRQARYLERKTAEKKGNLGG